VTHSLSPPLLLLFVVTALLTACTDRPESKLAAHSEGEQKKPQINLVDISETLNLTGSSSNWSAEVADFNADGLTDFLVVWHKPIPETLFLNNGKTFDAKPLGKPADRHHCSAGDVNLDGRIDLYCSVGARRGKGEGYNNLYIQQENGAFVDSAKEFDVLDPYGRGRWTTFLNANGDDYPDLFVTNTPERRDDKKSENRLFINNEGRRFSAAKDFGIEGEIGARCVVAADLNGDSLDELLVCGEKRVYLYLNEKGKHYADVSHRIPKRNGWSQAAFLDADNDGDLDLALINRKKLVIFAAKEETYSKLLFSASLQTAKDFTTGDIDGDGDLDIYLVQAGCNTQENRMQGEFGAAATDFMFINEGTGKFTKISAPTTQAGCGLHALTIDHDQDGDDGFVVLNGGGKSEGKLQFIERGRFVERGQDSK